MWWLLIWPAIGVTCWVSAFAGAMIRRNEVVTVGDFFGALVAVLLYGPLAWIIVYRDVPLIRSKRHDH